MWRAAGVAFLCVLSSSAIAEPVVLVSNDGFISFEGELLALDDNFYVVRTSVGEVRIPVSDVSCKGAGCPVAVPVADAGDQVPPELTTDRQIKLFKDFIEWRKNLAN